MDNIEKALRDLVDAVKSNETVERVNRKTINSRR